MLGRGVLQNPWLIGMLRSADPAGGEALLPIKSCCTRSVRISAPVMRV